MSIVIPSIDDRHFVCKLPDQRTGLQWEHHLTLRDILNTASLPEVRRSVLRSWSVQEHGLRSVNLVWAELLRIS